MENTGLWIQKEGHGRKDSLRGLLNDREISEEEDSSKSQLKKLIKRSNSHRAIVVNAIQSQISKVFLKDLFVRRVHGLDNRIPKHVVSVDEKYIHRCLEFIHNTALKAAQFNIPESLRATNMETLSESLNTAKFFGGNACGSGHFVFECPVVTETGRVVISANAGDQWTSGTIMGSKSMINILNSTLLQQFGASHRTDNLNRMNFSDPEGLVCYDFMDSPSDLCISSSYKLEKEKQLVRSHKYGSISVHKRLVSTSSTTSTCSDWLSSTSSNLSQGMIQCTWNQGIPHFVFSADDQKEVYVTKLRKVDSTDNKALDYVYEFHLNKGGQKGREIPDGDLPFVGKMHVSTSFTLCPNNCRIRETEFTLFHNIEISDKEMSASEHAHRKSKGLSKKVSKVFKTSPSSKRRTLSKFGGSSAISESCPWEPYALGGTNLLDTDVPPNIEMAAVVVKNHLPCKKPEKVGGWGLKFLNKSGENQVTLPSESCNQNNGNCSTSTSILIPAGLHGGPRTRNGGPSSLIDRWRSGGHCDCGGWDEGCPLTVLERRSNKADVMSKIDTQDECKSVDLVTQGSSDYSPTLRMVNVHDGLYYIHFHPPLSALQSFSIVVAIIHAQSPTLQPNGAKKLS
ncbi:uncharacterized protein LOC114403188 [Glycine soja]|uniref:Uncharacterized protein n=1 Tax=Glycine soja TaxID=3848 RepID=A0A445F7W9_GLYSO|nr:uncharacterized protein LOC114403188 [Glycine soja]XP_028221782.1 uncharacterized protein LOC114403188 [Glycine soja]XP_028221783.1 uncharacterized protein LOC114403188 [Glycine soja]KHN01034.1 hypothetical protein glysoja_000702 [Glycine soja]RZB44878.1 hypothetical protein D0Y65_054661 [Glycine soja]RZB44879.1 hypothetical protein D0Y65_054661 [Glycine soja]RZB44880.1 hypothetical protein D0Y65_054661 [Glycine soja]